MANSYEYGPFGQVVAKTEAVEMPYQFNTKMVDSETGLVYYGYRFYDAENGRWLNRDPIGVNGGINIYNSVSNNMVNGFSGGLSFTGGMNYKTKNITQIIGLDAWGLWKINPHRATTRHENLSFKAYNSLRNDFHELYGRYWYSNSMGRLLKGSAWPDTPDGLIYLGIVDSNHSYGVYEPLESGRVLSREEILSHFGFGYSAAVRQFNSLTYRTHFGDLQYWHAMAGKNDKDPNQLRAKILDRLRENFFDTMYTDKGIKRQCPDLFEFGKAMHTLQDSFSPSHVKRKPLGLLIEGYQSYTKQSGHKHGIADTTWSIFYFHAEKATEKVMKKLLIEKKTPREVMLFVKDKFFKHAPKVYVGKSEWFYDYRNFMPTFIYPFNPTGPSHVEE